MKRLFLLSLAILGLSVGASADNTTKKVAQVTEALSLTEDVDLHITGAEPFSESGSIDIVNTEHAVVIIDALRPSLAKALLSHITINGEAAADGRNCQVKLYDRGAILLPYGGTTFRALTVYDQPDFGGESETNSFTEGHANGYMKNVPNAWNNRIQSFRLKRGYMVTFALKKGGYGYSRCFIADKSDLEVNLPALMAGRISSYRIFKWYDTGKKNLANAAGDKNALTLLNVQSSYDWGQGNSSLLPDFEWVPNHIYEDWPSSSTIGQTSQSPHTKNNNEPRNSSDDHPQDLATILGNWENMMRTGLRLCSPASWDGSDYWNATGFLADFLDEVDKRGWRCDIIDLHCYWPEGNFGNVSNWANKYKRPIWISEWCWGASWSGNGSFSGSATEASFANAIKNITTGLNNNNAVERYYYWDGENGAYPCKLIRNGALTQAGRYYADMSTGPGYTGYGNYAPKAPPVEDPSDLTATFNANKMTCTLKWQSNNGDLADKVQLQRRKGTSVWETLAEWTGAEIEDKTAMSYDDVLEEAASFQYRVVETTYNNKTLTSNTATNSLTTSEGSEDLQYGTISSIKEEENIVFFSHPFEEEPIIIFGDPSYTAYACSPQFMSTGMTADRSAYGLFKMRFHLWDSDKESSATTKVNTTFIAAKAGRGQIGNLTYEAGRVNGGSSMSCKRTYEVTFSEPFESTPVVLCTPRISNTGLTAITWRIFDVTPEGFKIQLLKESSITNTVAGPCAYIAIEKGRGSNGLNTTFTVGDAEATFSRSAATIAYGYELENPRPMLQLQTNNDEAAANLRYSGSQATSCDARMVVDKSDTQKVLSATVTTTERVGYIVLSDGEVEYDAITSARSANSTADTFTTLTGIRVNQPTRRGVYIVGGRKVILK